MKKTKLFLPIRKVDEEQRLVYGTITEEVEDKSGETLDYAGSKPLFQKWSEGIAAATEGKSFGNVRVMHTNKVAGILCQELVFDDASQTIEACAKVIDDAEWELVKAGAYTGFSIGGRYVKRWEQDGQKRFIAEPVEVSLVDNPCVPTATFSFVKADGSEVDQEFKLWQPTNDEVASRAAELAKANGGVWSDHLTEAREQLIKAHADDESDEDEDDKEAAADGNTDEEADKADEGDDEGKESKSKESDDEDDDEDEDDDKGEAEKSATNVIDIEAAEPVQVWKTTDGKTFDKKADANSHQATLAASAVAAPLANALADLHKTVHGDASQEDAQLARILAVGTDLAPLAKALTQAKTAFDESVVNKSLYQVSRLADLLDSLGYVCQAACWERNDEKDNSPVPEMLAESIVKLGETLKVMAEEEVAEMIAAMQERGLEITIAEDVVELAATVEMVKTDKADLIKAGSRHNGSDKKRLQEIHRLLKELGVEDTDGDEEVAEKLAKFSKAHNENLELRKMIDDAVPAIEQLKKDVELLKSQPMPSAPSGLSVVTKGYEDGTAQAAATPQTLEDLIKVHGADNLATAAIRLAQQQGRPMVGR